MSDQDRSSQEPATSVEPAQVEPAFAADKDRPESRGRRQFLKSAALASAPVILTVASRPAWGNICAPSGRCSGNASDSTPESECYVLDGGGPAYWSNEFPNWPYPNDAFDATFGVGSNQKLKVRLSGGTVFEQWAIAALLNAANGQMDYLGPDPVAVIKSIVNEVLVTGTYEAAAGCIWMPADVVDYFMFTVGM
jgi:hypothetical protein